MKELDPRNLNDIKKLSSALETLVYFEILQIETKDLIADVMSAAHPSAFESWMKKTGNEDASSCPVDELLPYAENPDDFVQRYIKTIHLCLFDERTRAASADEIAEVVLNDQ